MPSDLNDSPNPFSLDQLAGPPQPRRSLIGALQVIAIVTILFAVLLAGSSQYRRHQLESLHNGFASLSPAEKLARLDHLAVFGADGLTGIVTALGDDDSQVSAHAHDLLRQAQKSWIVESSQQATANQMKLVAAIGELDTRLSAEAITFVQDLLQHTMQASVDQSDTPTRQLYFAATAALQQISAATDQPAASRTTLDDVRQQPLPVAHLADGVDWTDWPPRVEETKPIASAVAQANFQSSQPVVDRTAAEPSREDRLHTLCEDEVVVLRDIHGARTIDAGGAEPLETAYYQSHSLPPAAELVESPWQDADVGTVIKLMGSEKTELRGQAAAELTRRGFTDEQVSIAAKIVSDDARSKLALISSLTDTPAVDPRPWLIMLLRDPTREVKLHAVTALAAMNDPQAIQELRSRLVDEPDQTVAFRIRRVLNLR